MNPFELFWRVVFRIPLQGRVAPFAGRANWHFWKQRRQYRFLLMIWIHAVRNGAPVIDERKKGHYYWTTLGLLKGVTLEELYYEGPEITNFTLRIGKKIVLEADDLA